jgi:transposase
MAVGKRRHGGKLPPSGAVLQPRAPGHPFYEALDRALDEVGFDDRVGELVAPFYSAAPQGRPPISAGVYFRMLFVGYFEGLDSQRAISWRCSDSLSLRQFLGLGPGDETPDHSSLTRIRKRLTPAIHAKVFALAMQTAREKGALSTKRLGVNSKYVEANAAMRTIVRLDAADDWTSWLARIARVDAPKPDAVAGQEDEGELPPRAEEQQLAEGPTSPPTTPAAPADTRQDDANAGMSLE